MFGIEYEVISFRHIACTFHHVDRSKKYVGAAAEQKRKSEQKNRSW